ncbi:hypothetical protein B0H14DRAFT_3898271 [Mycena olivaceomarginata]|nr:hypothetical protein B0H14DRAFT_3898271 [Mycena olivaceomarginata]
MSSGLSSLPRDAPLGPRSRRPQRIREWEQGHRGMHDSAHVWQALSPAPVSPPCVDFPASRLHPRASAPTIPLSPSNDASPAAPSASPRAFVFGARKLQYVFEAVQTHAKYARCVQRAGRVRDAHHVPPTSTATFSSMPRAGPSRSCDQALARRRTCPISPSIRFFGDYFLYTPARNARPAHLPAPSQR